jgi:hypothetical protein
LVLEELEELVLHHHANLQMETDGSQIQFFQQLHQQVVEVEDQAIGGITGAGSVTGGSGGVEQEWSRNRWIRKYSSSKSTSRKSWRKWSWSIQQCIRMVVEVVVLQLSGGTNWYKYQVVNKVEQEEQEQQIQFQESPVTYAGGGGGGTGAYHANPMEIQVELVEQVVEEMEENW